MLSIYIMGIQELTTLAPRFGPELSGPSRQGNRAREKRLFLKEAGTCSGPGCQQASHGTHTGDPGERHGLCPAVIPSQACLKGGIQDPSGTALPRGIWASCVPSLWVSPPGTQLPSVLHEVSVPPCSAAPPPRAGTGLCNAQTAQKGKAPAQQTRGSPPGWNWASPWWRGAGGQQTPAAPASLSTWGCWGPALLWED